MDGIHTTVGPSHVLAAKNFLVSSHKFDVKLAELIEESMGMNPA